MDGDRNVDGLADLPVMLEDFCLGERPVRHRDDLQSGSADRLRMERQALRLFRSQRTCADDKRDATSHMPGRSLCKRLALILRKGPDRSGAAEDDDSSGTCVDELVNELA